MKNKYIYLIWFIAVLPTLILRDYTPSNELRYLNIVNEAIQNGNIFTFTNQGEIYADKPPLHFWLMIIGNKLLGEHRMWYYALLSFIPAVIIINTMTKWIRKENSNNETAATLMLMTTGLFTGVALVVRMDMLMNMFIILSLYTFYKMYKGENMKLNSYLFPIYVFLALFSKGPLGLIIPFVSTTIFLFFQKKISNFKYYWGWKSILIILLGCIVWFVGVYLEGGNAYLNNLLVHQTVGRGVNSFHHKEPFYYYLTSIWYSVAPWSLLSIPILIASIYYKKIKTELEVFFLIIIISTLLLLSVISSKLAIYSLPIIPFIIYLSVMLMKKFNLGSRWIKLTLSIPAIIFIFALPGIIYLSKIEETQYLGIPLVYVGACVITISGLVATYLIYFKNLLVKSIYSISFGIILTIFIVGLSFPQLNPNIGWGKLCEKAVTLSNEKQISDYWVYNISRSENMDVYLGKDIIKVDKEQILSNHQENKILIAQTKHIKKDEELRLLIENNEQYKIGKYTITVLK